MDSDTQGQISKPGLTVSPSASNVTTPTPSEKSEQSTPLGDTSTTVTSQQASTTLSPPSSQSIPKQFSSQSPVAQKSLTTAIVVNPNSSQNSLLIAEIRDGIVIMNDGSYRAVVMARSINFDLMSSQEREAIEYGYQSFLNSLYFDIQVFVRSQKIDLRPYLEKLDKLRLAQENMLVALMTENYMEYIAALSEQTNIMDKKFYVVIPYSPSVSLDKPIESSKKIIGGVLKLFKQQQAATITIDENGLEEAKQELKNRVQTVVNGLAQTGVQSLPLDTQELIELYYDYYNPDTATRQQLNNFNGFNVPLITKAPGGNNETI